MALIQMTMTSHCLKRSVQVNAYIPCDPMLLPGMEPDPGPWKTIYLLHGFLGDGTQWLGSDKIGEISKLYNVAVIMPNGESLSVASWSTSPACSSLFQRSGRTPSSRACPWAATARS